MIKKVVNASSADKAGIAVGDLIFAVNRKRSSENTNIYNLMRNRDTGDFVKLSLYKRGNYIINNESCVSMAIMKC